jgi:lysophospholipase L1-like esterase
MKTILCYGDSNTFGQKPIPPNTATGVRFDRAERWPGVLQRELGADYHVIEEGLNGRTTIWDDPLEPGRNGQSYLQPCLESHRPLDLVTIMLGTNDLKARFNLNASDIAQGSAVLASIEQRFAREVLLIVPAPLNALSTFDLMYDGAIEKSCRFAEYFPRMAAPYGIVNVLEAGGIVVASPTDGIHFDAPEHAKLGRAVAVEARRLIGKPGAIATACVGLRTLCSPASNGDDSRFDARKKRNVNGPCEQVLKLHTFATGSLLRLAKRTSSGYYEINPPCLSRLREGPPPHGSGPSLYLESSMRPRRVGVYERPAKAEWGAYSFRRS